MGKLGGSTRGAEHDSISVLSISALLLPDGVRAGDEVRLMLRREALLHMLRWQYCPVGRDRSRLAVDALRR